ncbi:DNA polymerase III subunit delta' [Fictibacillus phosphorivorans]|uniref:DNA polymerase III subunit delta' n=1 Tax=Fictibacillus phosphorivorans TaxID=1221500 RepID=UPI002040F738|nr:DNA polymerase III subunit delta' [Fictibacillus phosphorivorans]MCM3719899.1 DNA polymerase III subunit delta' [Fictibacillus phosphorivorans]MCM3777589.1 DNA polymerase III subunit delta' [Fictibacillus phosphorivorans]
MSWEVSSKTQPRVVKLLKNSIKKQRLAHAYIFEGAHGTGKMAVATALAKAFLCRNAEEGNPCENCTNCKRITSGNHPDVHIISPEGQSIKIDQIRGLQKEFAYSGMESSKKVYIVEHADKMTVQAANSLLKFLEEPGSDTIAILLTEQVHSLLDTIRSRAQTLSFSPLAPEGISQKLLEDEIPKPVAALAASLTSDYAEALEICREEWFAQARAKVIQLTEELRLRPDYCLVVLQDQYLSFFKEKEQLRLALNLLLIWYRDLLSIHLSQSEKVVFFDQLQVLEQQALQTSQKRTGEALQAILTAQARLRSNVSPLMVMEQLVLRLREG